MTALLRRFWWAIPLAGLLIYAAIEHRSAAHWRAKQAATQSAFDTSVANYRAAADEAARLDKANAERVAREQSAITEKVTHDYQAQIADARARADALRVRLTAQANSGSTATAGMPTPGTTAGGPDEAAREEEFSLTDRLIATEQAIQLEALQAWVRAQSAVDVGSAP